MRLRKAWAIWAVGGILQMVRNYWTQTFDRRKLLRAAGIGSAGLAGAVLVGCSDDGDDAATPSGTPQPSGTTAPTATSAPATPAPDMTTTGGDLRMASVGRASSLDLMTSASGTPQYHVGPVYSTLLTRSYDADLNLTLEPDLAESWDGTPDGLSYTFDLRKGVKFHNRSPVDGREMTTDDIKFSIEREIEGTRRPRRAQFESISKVEFPDDNTLKLTLSEPVADFINWIADPYHIIMPTEADDEFVAADGIGTGPFILDSFRPDDAAKFVRNPDYFRGTPYLDSIRTTIMGDQDSMIASFRAGNLDISAASSSGYLRPRQIQQVKSSVSDAQFFSVPNLNVGHFRYNLEEGPFVDKRVRQAIGLLIDDATWVEGLFDGAGARTAPVPSGHGKWSLPLAELPARGGEAQIKKSADLLAAAGYDAGNALTIRNVSLGSPPSVSTATGIALLEDALKKVNVGFEVDNNDYGTWLKALINKQFDFNMILGVLGFAEPGTYVETYFWDEGGRGYTKHGDATLNAMIKNQRVMLDEEERLEAIHNIQRHVVEEEYYTMMQSDTIVIAGQSNLRGYSLDLLHGGNMHNAWQWSLEA